MGQDVSVGIVGDDASLQAALAEAKGALSEFFETVTAESAGVGAALEDVRSKFSAAFQFTGIALATEAISQFGEMLESVGSKAAELHTVSEVIGVTTDQLQVMQHAAEEAGVSTESLTHAGEHLVTLLSQARDGSGAAAEKLFSLGISAQQVNDPMFTLNDLLEVLHDRLNDTTTSQDTMNHLIEVLGSRAALAAEAIKNYDGSQQSVAAVMDKLNGLTGEQIDRLREAKASWSELLTTIENGVTKLALGSHAPELSGMNALTMSNLNSGQMAQQAVAQQADPYAGLMDQTREAITEIDAQWKATAANAVAATQNLARESLKSEMDAVKAGVESFKQGTAERLQALQQYANLAQQYYGREDYDKVKAALAAVTVAQREYGQAVEQQYEATTRALEREGNAHWSLLQLQEQINSTYLANEQQKADKIRQIEQDGLNFSRHLQEEKAKGDLALLELEKKQRDEFTKQYGGLFSSISSSFSGAISGMMRGTETFADGMRNIFGSVVDAVIQMFVKMGVETVETLIENAVITRSSAVSGITANAALAAVAAAASVAAIPFYGWAMAPEVAASTFAAMEAYAAIPAAEGGFDVPRGINPVTQLHGGEMVLPASLSDTVRDMAAGRGGGGGNSTLTGQFVGGGRSIIYHDELEGALKRLGMQFKLKLR